MGEEPIWRRYRRLWGPDVRADVEDELEFHLAAREDELVAGGLSREVARARAREEFGDLAGARAECRSIDEAVLRRERRADWLSGVVQDLRYGLRGLGRAPGLTLVIVLTLALGIGANTAIFSVVDGVLLRPMPLADAGRLVVAWETDRNSGTTREPASWPDFVDYRREARSLSGLAAVAGGEGTLTPERGEPARVSFVRASADYFDVVGVRPLLGRVFTAAEARPGGARVALLSAAFWRERYGADPAVVGRTIRVQDEPYTVIGVLPEGASFGLGAIHAHADYASKYHGPADLWLPLQAGEAEYPRETHPFFMVGRLAPGATEAGAQRELAGLAARLERAYPVNDARGIHVEALGRVVFGGVRPALLLLLAAVALVLVVACVNVANLLLARGAARAREVAVRTALGAGLGRLGRQFLVESLLLAALGSAAGVALAYGGLRALVALAPADVPRLGSVAIDARVLAATFAISLLVALAFGLLPLAQAWGMHPVAVLRGERGAGTAGRVGRRVREALVVAELALSVTLVTGAGLLLHSLGAVLRVDPGFRAAGVVQARYDLPATRYPEDYSVWPRWPAIQRFDAAVLERVRALPGVQAAALANVSPLDPGFTNSWAVVGREAEARSWPEISVRMVSPGYFATLGVPLVRGRTLAEGDVPDAPRAGVLNATAVRRFFQHQDPLGQEVIVWGARWRVVGVVGDERIHGLTEAAPPALYVPIAQAPAGAGVVFARGRGDPAALGGGLRAAIHGADPGLAVYGVETLHDVLGGSVAERRFTMLLLSLFAGLALVLALVGIHGVLSYATARRTSELGIRMALGATRRGVLALVLGAGLALAALGTLLGLAGALAASRLLRGFLFGVRPLDPLTFVIVPVLVLAAAALASYLPARRAARLDPLQALRTE